MLEQLAAASLPIKIHIAAILPSTFLGTYILISKKARPSTNYWDAFGYA